MPRNLDLTALRAFATVAATGGVTRAAAQLNLTQSAVSMQVKRLEEALDTALLARTPRGMALTPDGEKALGYARRMLAMNDELLDRMKEVTVEGEIRLGVPHDIVGGRIPEVMRAFAAEYPRIQISLISSVTSSLRELFENGGCDIYLATEATLRPGGEELARLPLIWVGAPEGRAWQNRPLPLAFADACIFRPVAQAALDTAGIPWSMAMTATSSRAVDATVAADLACHVVLDGFDTHDLHPIAHGGALPDIGDVSVTLYAVERASDPAHLLLLDLLRRVYGAVGGARRPVLSVVGV